MIKINSTLTFSLVKFRSITHLKLICVWLVLSLLYLPKFNFNSLDTLNVTCFNSCGTGSSKPYICDLLRKCNVLGISEHWLSGPELYKLDMLADSCNKNCTYKCCDRLINGPPEKGRGYGGVAMFWDTNIPCSPLLSIKSDRIIGIKVSICDVKICIFQVYMPQPRDNCGKDFENTLNDLECAILEHVNDSKIIVMGDFNVSLGTDGGPRGSGSCSFYGKRLINSLYNDKCQLICSDMSNLASGPKVTFNRDGVGSSWIDHIFVSADLFNSILVSKVLDEELLNVSDHVPVEITLKLKSKDSCIDLSDVERDCSNIKPLKVLWHKLKDDEISLYTRETNKSFANIVCDVERCLDDDDVDSVTEIVTKGVINTSSTLMCNKCKTGKKGKSNAKPFWSEELTLLSNEKKTAYFAWVDAGRCKDKNDPTYIAHCNSKKKFRKAFRQTEAKFKAKLEETIENNSEIDQRQFWYLLKKDKKRNKKCVTLRNDYGEIVNDDETIVNMWKDHLENLGKPGMSDVYDDYFKDFVEHEISSCAESKEEMKECVLSLPISNVEVENVCKKLKTGKSQDINGVSYEHFKYAGLNVFTVLAMLFNSIIKLEVLPLDFVKSVTIPLFKGGKKDPLEKDNYRGITIQNVICKIYDNIIMLRADKIIRSKIGICNTQFACSKGLSSVNASLTLQETVCHLTETGSNVYTTFFDTRKALDTVWVDGLFYMLYCRGIKGKLWRLMRKAYVNCLTAVYVNGKMSDWFQLFQGVKQGAILSMLLYVCFINCVIKEMLESELGCTVLHVKTSCIGYADDIAALATDHLSMQRLIYMAYLASCKWRFEFSLKKCAVLIFGDIGQSKETFYLGSDPIVSSNSYNHVGVNLYTRGSRSVDEIHNLVNSCKRSFYCVIGQSLSVSSLSPLALSKIYWSTCISKLLANAEVKIYSCNELSIFENFHVQMAKSIQLLPLCTPNISALANLGWRTITGHIEYIRIMFIHRVFSLHVSEHRSFVIRRILFILANGIYSTQSPIAQAIEALMKYNLLNYVIEWIDTGFTISKLSWKSIVQKAMSDSVHKKWRFQLTLYPKLNIFRIVNTECKISCWCIMAKMYPFLKKTCCTMLKLLCGSNRLAVNTDTLLPRNQRLCIYCTLHVVEDLYHFVVECPKFADLRDKLHVLINENISIENVTTMHNLSEYMKFLIFVGLDFPLKGCDIWVIRYYSCIYLNNMYVRRKSFEPP